MENRRCWRILALCLGLYSTLSYSKGETNKTIESCSSSDAILPCTAYSYSYSYTSIIWYKKVNNKPEGILRFKGGSIDHYKNYNANFVSLTENKSLILKSVNGTHAGLYRCHLPAKGGFKSNESYVVLNVSECVRKTTSDLICTTTVAPQSMVNSSIYGLVQPVEVDVKWVLLGFIIQAMSKVLLSCVCVGVVVLAKRHRRKQLWQ